MINNQLTISLVVRLPALSLIQLLLLLLLLLLSVSSLEGVGLLFVAAPQDHLPWLIWSCCCAKIQIFSLVLVLLFLFF